LEYKNKLQSDLDLTVKRLERAEKLTILLKDEGLRWNNMIESFKNVILDIPGEAFLSSVILSYLGAFTGSYRENFVEEIMKKMKDSKIIFPKNFSLTTTMFDQITVRDWILEGLPNDPVSIDNAIIAKRGKRYPLMIDPQSQANKWLKINQKDKNLSVVNFDETHYLKTLETAVKCGYSVLI
jgi:dynein heavy chain